MRGVGRCVLTINLLALAQRANAQARPTTLDSLPGRVVARATSGPDSTQTFAIYYPLSYSAERRWPVLFVMDPRGRAMLALGLFASAAERHGFVVLSSYNTLSDGALEPNIGAINAMLSAAQTSIAADVSRLYIAGFSGTARIGWNFELEAPKNFAGLFAAGAAPWFDDTLSRPLLRTPGFALAMTAGTADFNWAEVRSAQEQLRRDRVPVRAEYFDGPHGWPPLSAIDRGLAWFKMLGMLGGRWPTDTAWMARQVQSEIRYADSLESAGHVFNAAEALAALSNAIVGRREHPEVVTRTTAMAARPAVVEMRRRLAELDVRDLERGQRLSATLADIRRDPKRANPQDIIRRLDIAELKRFSTQGDSIERPWAQRVLARTQVFLGFYEPRYYLDQRQPIGAVAMLEAVASISPLGPQHCALLAQAAALMSESERAKLPACPK